MNNKSLISLCIFLWGVQVDARGKRIDIFSQKDGGGDIVQLQNLPTESGAMMNALKRDSPLRWNNYKSEVNTYTIPYVITGIFNSEEKSIISKAMREIENNTCVRFSPRKNEEDYVDIRNQANEGCYTTVGRNPGRNIVMLEANSYATCVEEDIVVHELFHSLGLWHEQMRIDRDDYIKVHFENIQKYYYPQFEKVSNKDSDTFGIPYDYRSVMHYAEDAFADPGKISMEAKDAKFQKIIGKARHASAADFGKICILYKCEMCVRMPFEEKSFVARLKSGDTITTVRPVNPTVRPVNPTVRPVNPTVRPVNPTVRPPVIPPRPEEIPVYPPIVGPAPEIPPPVPDTGTSIVEIIIGNKDCIDVLPRVCSLISSSNVFFSCASLTKHICCDSCRKMEELGVERTPHPWLKWLG